MLSPRLRSTLGDYSEVMSQLELVTRVVRDCGAAIRFFVDVLQFELVEDIPSLTNEVAGSVGSWFVSTQVERCNSNPLDAELKRLRARDMTQTVARRLAG